MCSRPSFEAKTQSNFTFLAVATVSIGESSGDQSKLTRNTPVLDHSQCRAGCSSRGDEGIEKEDRINGWSSRKLGVICN